MSDNPRPFVAWDGEAVAGENGDHPYCLFGSSLGTKVMGYDLSTMECLALMVETEMSCPEAIHFGFAFGYDVNMILKDLPMGALYMLRKYNKTRYRGFDIEYIPRKWLRLATGRGKARVSMRLYDVFSFFGTGLVPTLRKYDIGTNLCSHSQKGCEETCNCLCDLCHMARGKGERPNFRFEDISSSIEPYWQRELSYMVLLMDKFREILYRAGIYIRSWHGPGAIASYLLRHHDVDLLMEPGNTDAILSASRYAYIGGRFEPFMAGYYEGTVYSADINSAYPYSISRLPALSSGKWRHELGYPSIHPGNVRLGLYRISYKAPYSRFAMPIPHRDSDGNVSFPPVTNTWIHAAEAAMVYRDPNCEFHESYLFEDDGTFPFEWVEELYEKRLAMQAAGDPTQIAFKLGPNSLYGQFAQRTGWERNDGPPRWHQLEWAGAITSECRSMVYSVAKQAGKGLLSIDTDGVLSLVPFHKLPNGSGNKLGQWKVTEYTGVLYVQNGIYWLRDQSGNWLPPKSRGIPRRKLSFDSVFPVIARNDDFTVSQHMFIGYGLALRGRMHEWRKWLDEPRTITFGGTGKRVHAMSLCRACQSGKLGYTAALHTLSPVPPKKTDSTPHYLPWLDVEKNEFRARERTMELEKWGIWE